MVRRTPRRSLRRDARKSAPGGFLPAPPLLLGGAALAVLCGGTLLFLGRPLPWGAGLAAAGAAGLLLSLRDRRVLRGFARGIPASGAARFLGVLGAFALGAASLRFLPHWSKPETLAPGLALLAFSVALYGFFTRRDPSPDSTTGALPRSTEVALLAAVLFLGAAVRFGRLGEIPSGVFVDQGFQGLAALRILHEGWRPFWVEETLHAPAYTLYLLAGWFGVFGADTVTLRSFYALHAVAALPLVYAAFRPLLGVRFALLTLFVLSVQRWHLNFSRNAFPNIQILVYAFGSLALLLHGWRTRKTWPFLAAGVLTGLGFYTYQAFKVFPLFLGLVLAWEWVRDRRAFRANRYHVLVFASVFALLLVPFGVYSATHKDAFNREKGVSVFTRMQEEGSGKPLVDNVIQTALMFHRRGDRQPRHNLQDAPMLDPISGVLFPLGLAFALARWRERRFFYLLAGLAVFSLPCLLSRDPAHANRLIGITPFLAALAALPLAHLVDRWRAFAPHPSRLLVLPPLAAVLLALGASNLIFYFRDQAGNYHSWKEYNIEATRVGRGVVEAGDRYDFRISPHFYGHHTIHFLAYGFRDRMKPFLFPDHFAPLDAGGEDRGICFVLEPGKEAVADFLMGLYPGARREEDRGRRGEVLFTRIWVEAEAVRRARGLRGAPGGGEARAFPDFPEGLPPGPWSAVFTGSLVLPDSDHCRFEVESNAEVSLLVDGVPTGSTPRFLERGALPVRLRVDAPPGPVRLKIRLFPSRSGVRDLNASSFTTLSVDRGVVGRYFRTGDFTGEPAFVRRDPLLAFTDGNELVLKDLPISVRWEGTLWIPEGGTWEFRSKPNDFAAVTLDGSLLVAPSLEPKVPGVGRRTLAAGAHSLRVDFRKLTGHGASYELEWKPPRAEAFIPVPHEAFGEYL